MKLKKELILTLIISIILINIPAKIFAWVTEIKSTYEVCNIINVCIAGTLRIVALVVGIMYIASLLKTKKSQKRESLILIIIQIAVLLLVAFFVTQIGMETRILGEKYQAFDFSDIFRIIAFVTIIFCIIKVIIQYASSEEGNKQKIITIAKWEVITAIIVAILLILAKNI